MDFDDKSSQKTPLSAAGAAAATSGGPKKERAAQPKPVASGPTPQPGGQATQPIVGRHFTQPGSNPYDSVEWEERDAVISNEKGEIIFEQRGVMMPRSWSQMATNIVVSKYFHGHQGAENRENSLRQLIGRVCDTITQWGVEDGYFDTEATAETFRDELTYLCLHQYAAFNSPVWFNVGVEQKPQCSACFINSIKDTMSDILDLAKTEGMLFKWGSGAGTNLSPIRSSREKLAGGGAASGPVSFMKGFDAFAGVIKSGGKTRRAAKMVILDVDHPDVEEFIECKAREEKKAHSLIANGYDPSLDGEVYSYIFFQNANHSVRVSDEFMRAVVNDDVWETKQVTDGEVAGRYRARDLFRKIADAAHFCGDPGIQFDTTINRWNPCSDTGRITASNPCSEYMFLDDTACNLASLNLMKFRKEDASFDVEGFESAVRTVTAAQDILVDRAGYPTESITQNSYDYRPLGLGYANLGALLMSWGLPYDSDAGRQNAAVITSMMCGKAYETSARLAEMRGSFKYYDDNERSFLDVIEMHKANADRIESPDVQPSLLTASRRVWDSAFTLGKEHGYRNAQVTVLAPTGTIGFMMDCDTTGVEPDIALVKYKKLVGGGMLKIVNQTVPLALERLGYGADQISEIIEYIDESDTIEGCTALKEEHLPIFDCAFKAVGGIRSISPMGHVRMMAAAQPFLSGAISKTVNLSSDATVEDIENAYLESWRLGLKAIAVYRDGCKLTQPLTTSSGSANKQESAGESQEKPAKRPVRRRLSDERPSITHKFSVAGHEGYLTVGLFEDHTPGELFIRMAKEGSVVSGLMDTIATATSIMLQYGVPLEVLVNKFSHMRFEPSGFTTNPKIPFAKSVVDYVFRWMGLKFLDQVLPEEGESPARADGEVRRLEVVTGGQADLDDRGDEEIERMIFQEQADAPPCHACGAIMVRSGACYKCFACGETSGCS